MVTSYQSDNISYFFSEFNPTKMNGRHFDNGNVLLFIIYLIVCKNWLLEKYPLPITDWLLFNSAGRVKIAVIFLEVPLLRSPLKQLQAISR